MKGTLKRRRDDEDWRFRKAGGKFVCLKVAEVGQRYGVRACSGQASIRGAFCVPDQSHFHHVTLTIFSVFHCADSTPM
ncbi:hypothetical protein [Pseudomonas viridiflava]|uniref:hypothetical protein n=1 Tax=Pseudomonas viridiflava TaxID=33069 RepID=UPI002EB5621E|nr:hypothetical protein [Pseudomonas viridiflava]